MCTPIFAFTAGLLSRGLSGQSAYTPAQLLAPELVAEQTGWQAGSTVRQDRE
ncbi:MAG TPA: hypothetical protein VFV38_25320 [Ktedonobacteraceae bacterium]|nr:hypothetical protein [Ktedonobacteraceae bacterium]